MTTTIKCIKCSNDAFRLVNTWVPDGHSDSGLQRICSNCGDTNWIFKGVVSEGALEGK